MRTLTLVLIGAMSLTALGLLCRFAQIVERGMHGRRIVDPFILSPHPSISPGDVVRIQVAALRRNDAADRGVKACFRFASPANRAQTGPIDRFAQLVRAEPYRALMTFKSVRFGAVEFTDGAARRAVILIDANGNPAAFLFTLSRHPQGAWMTDSVVPISIPPWLDVSGDASMQL